MNRTRLFAAVAVTAATTAVAVPAGATATTNHSMMTAHYTGVITKINAMGHWFKIRRAGGSTITIHVTSHTRYPHSNGGFMALHRMEHVAVAATLRATGHTWWATSVTSMM